MTTRLILLVLALLGLPAFAARAVECDEVIRSPKHRVVQSPAELAKLDAGAPVLLWFGPEKFDTDKRIKLTAVAVMRLRLQPGSVLANIDLSQADLSGWRAPGVVFLYADLGGAKLRGADLSNACFNHGSLEKADLGGAKLSGLRAAGTELAGARFADADLERAVLTCEPGIVGEGCDSPPADKLDFRRARLAGADIATPFDMIGADLTGATLDRTVLPIGAASFAAVKTATVKSLILKPGSDRQGEGDAFSAAELAELTVASGGNPENLIEQWARTPSFGCTGAAPLTLVEKAICELAHLAALDRILAATWRRVDRSAEQANQAAFLKTRNACLKGKEADTACIQDAYVARLTQLARGLTERTAAALGAKDAVLRPGPLSLKPPHRDAALMKRLLEAYGVSLDTASLRKDGDGVAIDAMAYGANTHTCSVTATVGFDAAAGVWRDAADDDTMSWLILPDGLVNASSDAASRFSCGARAFWPSVFFADPPLAMK